MAVWTEKLFILFWNKTNRKMELFNIYKKAKLNI